MTEISERHCKTGQGRRTCASDHRLFWFYL